MECHNVDQQFFEWRQTMSLFEFNLYAELCNVMIIAMTMNLGSWCFQVSSLVFSGCVHMGQVNILFELVESIEFKLTALPML